MSERIIEPGKQYYAGGTTPRIAGHGGVTDVPMTAGEYVPDTPIKEPKMVYLGGTVSSTPVDEQDDGLDDMDRELFK